MTTLVVTDLTVHRGSLAVVDHLSFTVTGGAVLALIGPNGAGKSTAFKGMLGLVPATGTVYLDGVNLLSLAPQMRARRVAWVPQRSRLAAALSCTNVVAQGRFAHTGGLGRLSDHDAKAVDQALTDTDARHLAHRAFTTLSAGEQQRVLLARALATGAEVILMDEPTAALDVGHALALLALVRRLAAAGRAMVVVLHQLDEVRRVADRALLLDRGHTISHGSVDDVLSSEPLRRVFGVTPIPNGALGFALAEGTCV